MTKKPIENSMGFFNGNPRFIQANFGDIQNFTLELFFNPIINEHGWGILNWCHTIDQDFMWMRDR